VSNYKYFLNGTIHMLEREITDEMIEEKIKELKSRHPLPVTILENLHEMSLEDTVRVLVLSEGLE